MQNEFCSLLNDLALYLDPILARFRNIHRAPTATSGSTGGRRRVEADPNEYLALLVDPHLAEFPLEALAAFHVDSLVSLSRDFSLQLMHHRLTGYGAPTAEEGEGEGGEGKKKDKGDKNKPPPRIPGLRDASKKQAKIIPLNRQVSW